MRLPLTVRVPPSRWRSRTSRAGLARLAPLAFVALAGTMAAAAPALAQEVQIPFAKSTLPNGMTVIFSEDHAVPQVVVNVTYGVGSRMERLGRTGFAHLFEHLMFMGTRRAPTKAFRRVDGGVGRPEQRLDTPRIARISLSTSPRRPRCRSSCGSKPIACATSARSSIRPSSICSATSFATSVARASRTGRTASRSSRCRAFSGPRRTRTHHPVIGSHPKTSRLRPWPT